MSLKARDQVKVVSGNTDLTLTADANESYRIKDVWVRSPASAYALLSVDRLVVGDYRVSGVLGNCLLAPSSNGINRSLLGLLISNGVFQPIPVAAGSTFKIENVSQAAASQVVLYDIYDKEDVRDTEPNGQNSSRYDFVQWGRYSTTLADGENLYATQQTNSSFPPFPFGAVVPAKHKFTLRGIIASPVRKITAGTVATQETQRLKLQKERTVLLDEDRLGLPFYSKVVSTVATTVGEGISFSGVGNASDPQAPYMFDTPLVFPAGDELSVYVTTNVESGAANIAVGDAEVGMIFNVEKGG